MKQPIFFFIFIFLLAQNSFSGIPQLSDSAHASLITCAPGKDFYESFGHSALRIHDPVLGIDRAYNYGTFDFDRPNFYSNFAKGNLIYSLSDGSYKRFVRYYVHFNRSVYEDVLNLTHDEVQALFEFLEFNNLPENRDYNYDYFYDNCSTRPRDVVAQILNGQVDFDGSYITTNYSIRELVHLYAGKQPWGELAIDLALGTPMDKIASPYEYMFLPDYLQSGFKHANIKRGDSDMPLIKNSKTVYQAVPEDEELTLFTPFNLFWFLFFLVALKSYFDFRKEKISYWLDVILFGFIGLLGSVLALISFFTDHKAAAENYNLLWAVPLHLPIAFLLPFIRGIPFLRFYFLATIAVLLILLIGSFSFIPQMIHYSLYSVMLALGVRSFIIFKKGK